MLLKVFCVAVTVKFLLVQVTYCRVERGGVEERCVTKRSHILSSIRYYGRCTALSYSILEPLYSGDSPLYTPIIESKNSVFRAVELIIALRGYKKSNFANITKSTVERADNFTKRVTGYFRAIYNKINENGFELRKLQNQTLQIDATNVHCNETRRDHDECVWNVLQRLNAIDDKSKQVGEEACDLVSNGHSYSMAQTGHVYSTFASECRSIIEALFNKYRITNKEVAVYEYAHTESLYNSAVNDYILYSQPNEIQLISSLYNKLHKLEILVTSILDARTKTTDADKLQALTALSEDVTNTYIQQGNFISSSLKQVIDFNFTGRVYDATIGVPVHYNLSLDSSEFFAWTESVRKMVTSAINRLTKLYNHMIFNFPSDKPWFAIKDALNEHIQRAMIVFPDNGSVHAGLMCFKNCDYTKLTALEIKQIYKACSVIVKS